MFVTADMIIPYTNYDHMILCNHVRKLNGRRVAESIAMNKDTSVVAVLVRNIYSVLLAKVLLVSYGAKRIENLMAIPEMSRF